ncbi:hypothetical protein BDR04DRAFT_1090744 [Suillus decipiens]|nr:hypothetical protein BDR04DRAFT_1090744 [Suillus decipiens]
MLWQYRSALRPLPHGLRTLATWISVALRTSAPGNASIVIMELQPQLRYIASRRKSCYLARPSSRVNGFWFHDRGAETPRPLWIPPDHTKE